MLSVSQPMGTLGTVFLYCLSLTAVTAVSLPLPLPLPRPSSAPVPLHVTALAVNTLQTFGSNSWAENLAIRSSGALLVTRLDTPILQQLDPLNRTSPITVHTFDTLKYIGLLGITEVSEDIFYVAVQAPYTANFTTTSPNAVFKIDMTSFCTFQNGSITRPATVTHVVDLPTSVIINGATTLDSSHILIGDTYLGLVYNVDITTQTYTIPLNLASVKPPPNTTTSTGVNGIKVHGPYLYFTNLAASTLSRVLITPWSGNPIGASELVANVPGPDDFAIRDDGTIFIAGNPQSTLYMLRPGSAVVEAVAGSNTSTVLEGVSAAKFGRLNGQENRLFLTTSGGGGVAPATVAYVDTSYI